MPTHRATGWTMGLAIIAMVSGITLAETNQWATWRGGDQSGVAKPGSPPIAFSETKNVRFNQLGSPKRLPTCASGWSPP